jgi:hypothetical protein
MRVVPRNAASDAEFETPIAEDVGDRGLLGDLDGLCSGSNVTAVPRRICFVRCAAAASAISGSASIEKGRMK